MNASQTGCQRGTFIHFLLKHHYERMTQMIRRLDWVSDFEICITTARLCAQKMKRCIKAHDRAHTPLTEKGGGNWSNFFLTTSGKSLCSRINHNLFPACFREYVHLSKPLLIQTRLFSSHLTAFVSGLQWSDWFYKTATRVYHLASYPVCNCTVLTNVEP